MGQLIAMAVMAFALGLCIGGAGMYWLIMFIEREERADMHALALSRKSRPGCPPTG